MRVLIAIFCCNVLILLVLVMMFGKPPASPESASPATPSAINESGAAPLDASREGATPANVAAALSNTDQAAASGQLPSIDPLIAQQFVTRLLIEPLRVCRVEDRDLRASFSRAYVPEERRTPPEVSCELTEVDGCRMLGTLTIRRGAIRGLMPEETYAVVVTADQVLVGPDSLPATEWMESIRSHRLR